MPERYPNGRLIARAAPALACGRIAYAMVSPRASCVTGRNIEDARRVHRRVVAFPLTPLLLSVQRTDVLVRRTLSVISTSSHDLVGESAPVHLRRPVVGVEGVARAVRARGVERQIQEVAANVSFVSLSRHIPCVWASLRATMCSMSFRSRSRSALRRSSSTDDGGPRRGGGAGTDPRRLSQHRSSSGTAPSRGEPGAKRGTSVSLACGSERRENRGEIRLPGRLPGEAAGRHLHAEARQHRADSRGTVAAEREEVPRVVG